MSDIVERLREADSKRKALYLDMEDVEHLQDTITALRVENERLRANQINGDEGDELVALRAEVERLREALETTTDDCKNAFHENERLRAALEKRACSCLICERSPEDQDDHCEARAALKGGQDAHDDLVETFDAVMLEILYEEGK